MSPTEYDCEKNDIRRCWKTLIVSLAGNSRMDFAIVVLSVHDDDEVCGDINSPAE